MPRDAKHLKEINNDAKSWILNDLMYDIPFTESFEKALKEYEPCITKIERVNITILESYDNKEVNLEIYKVAYITQPEFDDEYAIRYFCEIYIDKKNFDRLLKLERLCN